ncbi:PLP-dependent aminotransferase family protein [Snodgrassella sp. CFCC 13594]|uniref:aminotransferase-like domain-containing protein n=1 Tax=Snodgrassella sp. CFCC 13594 TaxID=1775559 RepID=UPI00082D5F60|nr:PLP-dependent aminotransferase family protein [Snodgrassella sp. CFCC 13594]
MNTQQTRIEMVMAHIREQVDTRIYLPGTRLPSVRSQAKAMQFSVSTVVEAYERLAAEGIIIARPGSGFYVNGLVTALNLAQMAPSLDREIDPLWISRQSLVADEAVLKPGCGWLPATWLYHDGMRRALRYMARAHTEALTEYATPLGNLEFRHFLSHRLAKKGINASPTQIMLTDSGTHAIDLIGRFVLQPGDYVLVDDPCYFNFHALLKAHRVHVVGVPYTPDGPDVRAFEQALQHRPKLYITNSAIHNPTGAVLTPTTAHRILKLADAAQLIVVEDDIFADFEYQAAPRLAAFDGLSQVIHIGSFAKTVSASLRCGYIAARPEWIDSLIDLKIATSFGGSSLAADVLLATLTNSGYRKHMESVRLRLAQAMMQTIHNLDALGIKPWIVPQAGMFLWCCLPFGITATDLSQRCLKQGVILAPGNAFSLSLGAGQFMRFNVAQSLDPKIFMVLKQALQDLRNK